MKNSNAQVNGNYQGPTLESRVESILIQLTKRLVTSQAIFEANIERGVDDDLNRKALRHDMKVYSQATAFFTNLISDNISHVDRLNASRFNASDFAISYNHAFFSLRDNNDPSIDNGDFALRGDVNSLLEDYDLSPVQAPNQGR